MTNSHSPNLSEELKQQLQALVPAAFKDGQLDADTLQQLLGIDVASRDERYGLNWAGKADSYKALQNPTSATLRPRTDQSVDFEHAQHVFIEGENLEVLKVLQRAYFGKVKMIYIDPPYNTGSDSFIYPDRFQESREDYLKRIESLDIDGNLTKEGLFRKNSKDSGHYHSNWLSMMLPRLYLARNLLRDDGVIFISIDDNEQSNLKLLCDEIFGSENFIGCAARVTKKSNNKGEFWAPNFDYVLSYTKNKEYAKEFFGGANIEAYDQIETEGDRKGEKYQLVRLYMSSIQNRNPDQRFYIECPDGSKVIPPGTTFPPERPNLGDGIWRWTRKKIESEWDKIVVKSVKSSNLIDENKQPARYNVFTKTYLNDVIANSSAKPNSLIENFINQMSSHELTELGIPFDYAKPSKLIDYLLKVAQVGKDDLILDFFAGSGTTAHAVIELNIEDSGTRKYICVQMPEPTDDASEAYAAGYKNIADISRERIRRVIDRIKQKADLASPVKENDPNLGFRAFELAPSNFKQWRGDWAETAEELDKQLSLMLPTEKRGATSLDMAFELLLKNGRPLVSHAELKTIVETPVYIVWSQEAEENTVALIFVLESMRLESLPEMLAYKPKHMVFLDSVFKNNDSVKVNVALQCESAGVKFSSI